ncbi:hypothetical protein FXO38_10601 [Capsicum annuum]|nr:hypothetical protein FXO38_10601 [Capsicum annuum]
MVKASLTRRPPWFSGRFNFRPTFEECILVDLVKEGGHRYFIRFLDSGEAYPEQRAMSLLVLAVIVDGQRRGQEACIVLGLINVFLKHIQASICNDAQTELVFLQRLCLCLRKLWKNFKEAQVLGFQADADDIGEEEDYDDEGKMRGEFIIRRHLSSVFYACPLVPADLLLFIPPRSGIKENSSIIFRDNAEGVPPTYGAHL